VEEEVNQEAMHLGTACCWPWATMILRPEESRDLVQFSHLNGEVAELKYNQSTRV
jgi:hypothetical protein